MRASVETQNQNTMMLQFVVFQVGTANFAIEINRVKEILRYRAVTPLPKLPDFLEGVIDLRGTLIPIIDLRRRFEVSSPNYDSHTRIIVLRMKGRRTGLIVDAVQRVLPISIQSIQVPPELEVTKGANEYILAVAKHGESLYIIPDLDKILSDAETITLDTLKLDPMSPEK